MESEIWHSSRAMWWKSQDKILVNPTQVREQMPLPVLTETKVQVPLALECRAVPGRVVIGWSENVGFWGR